MGEARETATTKGAIGAVPAKRCVNGLRKEGAAGESGTQPLRFGHSRRPWNWHGKTAIQISSR